VDKGIVTYRWYSGKPLADRKRETERQGSRSACVLRALRSFLLAGTFPLIPSEVLLSEMTLRRVVPARVLLPRSCLHSPSPSSSSRLFSSFPVRLCSTPLQQAISSPRRSDDHTQSSKQDSPAPSSPCPIHPHQRTSTLPAPCPSRPRTSPHRCSFLPSLYP
jgi:hypothetical protein